YQTLSGTKTRRLHSLNMAKVACEELAKLIFNEKVQINISDKEFAQNIAEILDNNRFYKVFQNKIEQMFALGGLVIKPYVDTSFSEKVLKISYVTPDCFIPTSYNSDDMLSGVFIDTTRKEDKVYYLIEAHNWIQKNIEGETKKVYTI